MGSLLRGGRVRKASGKARGELTISLFGKAFQVCFPCERVRPVELNYFSFSFPNDRVKLLTS